MYHDEHHVKKTPYLMCKSMGFFIYQQREFCDYHSGSLFSREPYFFGGKGLYFRILSYYQSKYGKWSSRLLLCSVELGFQISLFVWDQNSIANEIHNDCKIHQSYFKWLAAKEIKLIRANSVCFWFDITQAKTKTLAWEFYFEVL